MIIAPSIAVSCNYDLIDHYFTLEMLFRLEGVISNQEKEEKKKRRTNVVGKFPLSRKDKERMHKEPKLLITTRFTKLIDGKVNRDI